MLEGIKHPSSLFADYENAGLYSGFYAFLALFIKDPVALYLYGANILVGVTCLSVFFCLAVLSRSLAFSCLALCVLYVANMPTIEPRVSFASISIMALSLIVAQAFETQAARLAIMALAAFIGSFIRPQFVLTFYITGLLCLIALWLEVRAKPGIGRVSALTTLGVAACVVTLSLVWSFPLLNDHGRAYLAFGQAFALRTVTSNHLITNPWLNWQSIDSRYFLGAHSVGQALQANPVAFGKFVLTNCAATVWHLLRDFVWPLVSEMGLRRAVFFVALVLFLLQFQKQNPKPGDIKAASSGALQLGIIALLLPVALGCALVFPRQHYVIMLVFLIMCLLALFVRHLRPFANPVASIVAMFALVFNAAILPVNAQVTLKIIRKLQQAPKSHIMFEVDGGWCAYVVPRCNTIFAYTYPQGSNLEMFLKANKVDSIFVSQELLHYAPVAAAPYFNAVLSNPHRYGWTPFKVDAKDTLLLRTR